MSWLLVFVGGGLGSVARYAVGAFLNTADLSKGQFPWPTLVANTLACLLLGAGIALLSRSVFERHHGLLLMTGFCGGFSTFSTFSAELLGLYEAGHLAAALAYLSCSLLIGVGAIALGAYLLR